MQLNRLAVLACLVLLFLFHITGTYGQSNATWTGGVGNWSDSNNWSPATVPNNTPSNNFFVTIGGSNSVVTMDLLNVSISELTLSGTNSVNINTPDELTLRSVPSSNSGTINNSGSFLADSPLNNYGTLNNGGTFGIGSCCGTTNFGTINNTGAFSNAGGFDNQGAFNNFGNVHTYDGSVMLNEGTLNNFGTLTTAAAAIVNSGTLNNLGTLILGGTNNSGTLYNSGAITNVSTLNNMGTLYNSGTFNNFGAITNLGTVTISNSGLFTTTSANYTQTAGNTIVNGMLSATGSALVDIERGALSGTGTINGNVAMGGTLTPGVAGTPGTFVIFGNYEQLGNGTLKELVGPVSHSFLDVSGNVILDPASLLDITLLNGFDPLNQTFSIMDFGSRVGQFSNGPSFSDDGFIWDITYRQHEVDVTAVQRTPEPSSLLLLFIGLAALAFYAPRRMDKTQRLA